LRAEAQDKLCRADYMPVTTNPGENEPVRHSSAGGINRQDEWRRPAGLAERRPLPHRRPSGPSVGRAAALELDASGVSDLGSSGVTTHVNKVHHVTTITQVARDLEEDEDWLWDIANEMEIEDGVIWVYGVGEDGILAFTDFGIESLIELIKMHKNDPTLLKRWNRSE